MPLFIGNRELVPALPASSVNYCSSMLGFHTGAETVFISPLALGRLKRHLHSSKIFIVPLL